MGELMTTQTLKWCNKLVHRELPTLAHFHFHELRHTFASTLVLNGADIKDVQELMGHSDIRITLNTYTHSTSCSRKHAAAIFEKAIAK
jgi:site-specific recombinase XerD